MIRIFTRKNLSAQESKDAAFEMAKTPTEMQAFISFREGTVFEHTFKMLVFPNDSYNQSKWRNEIASKYVEINDKTSAQSKGNKFKEKLYRSFFDSMCSNEAEVPIRISTLKKDKDMDKAHLAILDKLSAMDYKQLFLQYTKLKEAIIPIFCDKTKADLTRDEFRAIIDKVIPL